MPEHFHEASVFSAQDLVQIREQGLRLEVVLQQLHRFTSGFPPLQLVRPVTYGDGVLSLSEGPETDRYVMLFEQAADQKQLCKFVPASGAASRMFKALFAYRQDLQAGKEKPNAEATRFFQHLDQFAFYPDLEAGMEKAGLDLSRSLRKKDHKTILDALLGKKGLNYGSLPKALIPFHRYPDHCRTALEEHLVEGALYARSAGDRVQVHFTVSEEHQARVQAHIRERLPQYEQLLGCRFQVETSIQHPRTDTIAVDLDNRPFREEEGKLVFRPGGHGALLENLNGLDADLVFIKNIDNVVPDRLKGPTIYWKKVIGGVLLDVQQQAFAWLRHIDRGGLAMDDALERKLVDFLTTVLNIGLRPDYQDFAPQERRDYVRDLLNRPLRVIGVIKTETNTGGGPFWVEMQDGSQSLQIVETAQLTLNDPGQQAIAVRSRFANITDLVCGIRNYRGEKFDLLQYRDENTGFITQKSLQGRALRALEHPGLWNGAMAYWNTLLVEVPSETFNPVKSVVDLLGEEHRR